MKSGKCEQNENETETIKNNLTNNKAIITIIKLKISFKRFNSRHNQAK